ncbi:MAG: tetratricopeptide repeat protein [Bdellovibrionota bacterium]
MTDEAVRRRRPSEILKRGYSDQEIDSFYALARFSLETGNLRRAEALFRGITEAAPEYYPAWLGLAYVQIEAEDFDPAVYCIRQALRASPNSIEAMLYLATVLLSTQDYGTAGSYLGEVGDLLETTSVDVNVEKFYKIQLARYQNR